MSFNEAIAPEGRGITRAYIKAHLFLETRKSLESEVSNGLRF